MTNIWLYVGGAALLVLLVAVLWKKIVRAALLLSGMALTGAMIWALAQQATATKQAATAATVAATGSAAVNVAVVMLLGVFVIGIVVIGCIALRRYLTRDNVTWRDYAMPLQQPEYHPGMTDQSSLNALVQLEVLRMLRELRAPQSQAVLAMREDDDDNDYGAWWGNA